MSIIKKVDREKIIFAENNVTVDHNHLANREAYGAHPISAIRKLPEKLHDLKQQDSKLEESIQKTNERISNIVGSNVYQEDLDNLEEKLQNNIDNVESNIKNISLKESKDDTLTFTDYNGETTVVRSGHKVDEDTIILKDNIITLNKVYTEKELQGDGTSNSPITIKVDTKSIVKNGDNELTSIALYDEQSDDKVLTSKDIHDQFSDVDKNFTKVNQEIEKVKDKTIADYDLLDKANKAQDDKLRDLYTRTSGMGGYLNAYDFGKAEPTKEELTAYALSQIDSEDKTKIFNQTKVKNLFDDNIWILTNTPDSNPAVFDWANAGKESIADANNDGLHGLVTGSNEQYECSVDALGHLSVNGLSELEQRVIDNFEDINFNIGDIAFLEQAVENPKNVSSIIDALAEHNQRILNEHSEVNELTGEVSDLHEADETLDNKIEDVITNKTQVAYNYHLSGWDTDQDGNQINQIYSSAFFAGGANANESSKASITIGANAKGGQNSIVLGHNTKGLGNGDIIFGYESARLDANESTGSLYNGIGIGTRTYVKGLNVIAIGTRAESLANDAIQLGRGTNTEAGTLKVKDFTLLDKDGKIPNERLTFNLDDYIDKTSEQTISGSKTFTNFNLQVGGNKPIQMQAVENGELLLQQSNVTLGSSVSIKTNTVSDVQTLTLAAQKGNDSARVDISESGFIFDVSDIKNDQEELTSVTLNSSSVEVTSKELLYNGKQVATLDDIVDVGFLTESPFNTSSGIVRSYDLNNTSLKSNIQEILQHVNNQNGGTLLSVSFKTGADNISGDVTTIIEQGEGNVPELDTDYGQPVLAANSFYCLYPEQISVNGNRYAICFGCKTNYPYGKGIVTIEADKNTTTGLFENATATLSGEAFYVHSGIVYRYYFQNVDILNEMLNHLTIKYTYYTDI